MHGTGKLNWPDRDGWDMQSFEGNFVHGRFDHGVLRWKVGALTSLTHELPVTNLYGVVVLD